MLLCDRCKYYPRGNKHHPNGWTIHEHTEYSHDKFYPAYRDLPEQSRVCSPCEKIVGDANMRLAGYKRNFKGVWTR